MRNQVVGSSVCVGHELGRKQYLWSRSPSENWGFEIWYRLGVPICSSPKVVELVRSCDVIARHAGREL